MEKKKKKKKHRFFWFMIKLQILLMLVVLAGFGYYYFGGYADEVQRLKRDAVIKVAESGASFFVPAQSSEVYDIDGNLISERKGEKDAQYVMYEDIPTRFTEAMISVEDKKFYSHNGVDFQAVLRAAKEFVKMKLNRGGSKQGASTITMQLAKLMYMNPDQTWQYKVEQMFIAMELEKRYSKGKILEFYLNNICFSNGYYGIVAACRGYFDCELQELDLSEIAFLCAIPNSPSYYDPVTNYDHTIERRNRILKNMLEDGKITQETYYEAVLEEISLRRPQESANIFQHNYVDTYTYYCATKALMEQEGFEFQYYFPSDEAKELYEEQYDELYAACQKKLYAGGYRIYTSIDMEKQRDLQEALDVVLKGFTETYDDGVYQMQGSAVCIDNETGYVEAIVGGREQDFGTYTLNRAYQSHRQPGSSVKPLVVYTPALERGYEPDTMVDDHKFEGGPENASGYYAGEVTLRYAVAQSLNTVAWQIYEELTPAVGLQYLLNMDFTGIVKDDYIPATSLGGFTKGASALEMASAYAALENDGLFRQPTCIKLIIDSDENIVYESKQTEIAVYDKTAARKMTDMMTTVMTDGTGKKVNLKDMPCAGKTGTTDDHKDGWFIGYTRYYTTSVWVGYDYPKRIENLTGNSYPGRIWKRFMQKIHEGLAPMEFLPYAQLSEDFIDQLQQEQDAQDERREEGQHNPYGDNHSGNGGGNQTPNQEADDNQNGDNSGNNAGDGSGNNGDDNAENNEANGGEDLDNDEENGGGEDTDNNGENDVGEDADNGEADGGGEDNELIE